MRDREREVGREHRYTNQDGTLSTFIVMMSLQARKEGTRTIPLITWATYNLPWCTMCRKDLRRDATLLL